MNPHFHFHGAEIRVSPVEAASLPSLLHPSPTSHQARRNPLRSRRQAKAPQVQAGGVAQIPKGKLEEE